MLISAFGHDLGMKLGCQSLQSRLHDNVEIKLWQNKCVGQSISELGLRHRWTVGQRGRTRSVRVLFTIARRSLLPPYHDYFLRRQPVSVSEFVAVNVARNVLLHLYCLWEGSKWSSRKQGNLEYRDCGTSVLSKCCSCQIHLNSTTAPFLVINTMIPSRTPLVTS
jgi:hypothetical protein